MSEPTPKGQTINVTTRTPQFVEDKDNTCYANIVNVAFDASDCCLTFMRKPRPMSLDLSTVKAGEIQLEMNPVSRVYLPVDVARALCQAMAQNLAAMEKAREAGNNNGGGA